ncbi:hypothetical protein TWF506_002619 [Arthrobotrys conoides]|uniref:Uncharacterized protein n=1 Tax=Arthrobotrys conoides TaxID=74498 RepID=A0AAN8NP84_9PEZI
MLDERETLRPQPQQSNKENDTAAAAPLTPSRKLQVLGIGLASPEFFAYQKIEYTPGLWKAIHPRSSEETISLEPADFDDVTDRDPEWKLLRRYPLLIPNEGLRNIFRRPYLPPSSELLFTRAAADAPEN